MANSSDYSYVTISAASRLWMLKLPAPPEAFENLQLNAGFKSDLTDDSVTPAQLFAK